MANSLKDVIENTKKIYMTDSALNTLLDFERIIDELDIYTFDYWKQGELVAGPDYEKYFVTCTFMWPHKHKPDTRGAKRLAEQESVALHYYSVIYDIVDQIKGALTGMLAPQFKEEIVGIAEVRDVFRSPKIGAIAGCMVVEGAIKRNNPIRVLRNNVVIYEGTLESLRRFKDDVSEVRQGFECGIGVKNYNDVKPGDLIEVFETIEIKRNL